MTVDTSTIAVGDVIPTRKPCPDCLTKTSEVKVASIKGSTAPATPDAPLGRTVQVVWGTCVTCGRWRDVQTVTAVGSDEPLLTAEIVPAPPRTETVADLVAHTPEDALAVAKARETIEVVEIPADLALPTVASPSRTAGHKLVVGEGCGCGARPDGKLSVHKMRAWHKAHKETVA